MGTRMSQERHTVYVERRLAERETSRNRAIARRVKYDGRVS